MVAARAGQVEVVRRLVEAGADTTQVREGQEEEEEGRGAHRSTGREREGGTCKAFIHTLPLSLCVAVTVGPVCGLP